MKFNTPSILKRELQAGFENQRAANEVRRQILKSYTGQGFTVSGQRSPENRAFAYVTRMTPKCVSGNPKAVVTHGGGYEERKTAAVCTAGLNQWIVQTKHARFLERMIPYFLSAWGVALTVREKVRGYTDTEDDVTLPNCVILDPSDVTWDPYATAWETKRWCAHRYARDADDLIEFAKQNPDEGWNVQALELCAVDSELGDLARKEHLNGDPPPRRELVLYDVWCAGEPGTSGYLYTFTMNGSGEGAFVREVRDYFGPKTGPYTLFGTYAVPNRSLPMSPLMAVWGAIDELNAHAEAASTAAKRGKSIMIADLPAAFAKSVHDSRDGDTVNIPGWKKENADVYQYGYLTAERINYLTILSDRVDRILGMNDADRGFAAGNATATENGIAATATNEITGFVAQRFTECAEDLLMTVLWYLYHDDTAVFDIDLKDEERQAMGVDRVVYRGGDDGKFDGYMMAIEQYSMQRMSEATLQKRSADLFQIATGLMPLIPQLAPFVDVELLFQKIGDAMNMPELSKIVSADKAAEMLSQQTQIQAGAGQPGGPPVDSGAPAPQQPPMAMAS